MTDCSFLKSQKQLFIGNVLVDTLFEMKIDTVVLGCGRKLFSLQEVLKSGMSFYDIKKAFFPMKISKNQYFVWLSLSDPLGRHLIPVTTKTGVEV